MRRYSPLPAFLLCITIQTVQPQAVRLQDLHRDEIQTARPFGTLRQQAEIEQEWLAKRLTTVLPALMRKHRICLERRNERALLSVAMRGRRSPKCQFRSGRARAAQIDA